MIDKSLHLNSKAKLQAEIEIGLRLTSHKIRLADEMSREQALTALEVFFNAQG